MPSTSTARVTVDNDQMRSNYTIHVEHPAHDRGVRCFHRNTREMVVSGLKNHLDRLTEDDIQRVDVVDRAGLGLDEPELLPDAYSQKDAFAPATPAVTVLSQEADS